MDTQETKKPTMGTWAIRIAIIIAVIIFILMPRHSNQTPQKVEKITCFNCGKDLTNTNNYIDLYDGKYACTLCYDKTQKEIKDEMKAEGYNVK